MQLVRRKGVYGITHRLYRKNPNDPVFRNMVGVLRGLWYNNKDFRYSDNYGKFEGSADGWIKVAKIHSEKQFKLITRLKNISI